MKPIKYPSCYAPARFEREINGCLKTGDANHLRFCREEAQEMLEKSEKWLMSADGEHKEMWQNAKSVAVRILSKLENLDTQICACCGDEVVQSAMKHTDGEWLCQSCEAMQQEKMTYRYEWKTVDEIISNLHTRKRFEGWGTTTAAELTRITNPETYKQAHALWLKLQEAFDAEAATYEPEAYTSRLGSVGEVEQREVLRSDWWETLNGDSYGDYGELTLIIEFLHHGETLETGKILFGS